jgi:hypothetical protein
MKQIINQVEFAELWASGMSGAKIAEHFGVSDNTVFSLRDKLDLSRRRKPGHGVAWRTPLDEAAPIPPRFTYAEAMKATAEGKSIRQALCEMHKRRA